MGRRHCYLNLISWKATNGSGWPVAATDACSQCQGCGASVGEQGIAGNGIKLLAEDAGQRVVLQWKCPVCECAVTEDTTLISALADAGGIDGDRLCWRCRK